MKLSIIVPAHNEQVTILQILEKVADVNIALQPDSGSLSQWEKEIIVVDDGSRDGTAKAILQWASLRASNYAHCINHPINLGKGAAIKSALEKVTGDYVIIQDADLEYEPKDIPKLLSALSYPHPGPLPEGEGGKQVVVYGNRGTKRYPERGFHYVVGAKLLTWTINLLYGSHLSDLYTGYKLIPVVLIKSFNLEAIGFEFEAEVTCKILKSGTKIVEWPINYHPRNKEQGKHIRFKDFLKGLWTIVKFRVK